MGMFFGNINPKSFLVGDKIVSKILRNTSIVWEKADDVQYLCFTAEEAGSTVAMKANGGAPTVYLETSPTGKEGSWTDFKVGSTTITLANVGDKVYFRAKQDNERFGTFIYTYNQFIMTGKIAASGNINTLLKADGSVLDLTGRDYCFVYLFYGCNSLTNAAELILPATQLAISCYYGLFVYCTSLTQSPELPATELASYCYGYMFNGCSSLTQSPELPATTLADGCYAYMFQDCYALTQAPELPATTLIGGCYGYMFNGCSSLTQSPELPATTLANDCYRYMFRGCSSLTQAPELPATTLESNCYEGMFQDCSNLYYAPELPATTLIGGCYQNMFYNCGNIRFIRINADEYNEYAYNAFFEMFNCATSLNEIQFTSLTFDEAKSLLTNNDVAQGMFNNVDPLYVAVYFEDGYYSSLADLLETELKCLKFTNTTDDGIWDEATLILENNGPTESEPTLVCSRDGGSSWETFYINNYYIIYPNETMMIRAEDYTTNSTFSNIDGYFRFSNNYNNNRKLKVEGNIKWLISMDESAQYIENEYMFQNLFNDFNFTYDSNITIPKPYNPFGNPTYRCYDELFYNSNINRITLEPNFESWYDENGNDQHWTYEWVMNVPINNDYDYNYGTFYCNSNLPIEYANNRIPEGWNVENI